MPSRVLSVVGVSLSVLGCADMLGLGGLTYDQGEDEIVAATGGTENDNGGRAPEGDGDGDLNLGGVSGQTEPDSFSVVLDRRALIAASPMPRNFPEYFFFDPGQQRISFRTQDEYRSVELGTWEFPSPEGLSHLTVVPHEGGMTLIGYDAISGFTSQATVSHRAEFEIVSTDVGTSGRSALLSFLAGDEWLALSYSSSDGNYRYFRPAPAELPEVFAGEWDSGWTALAQFSVGTDTGVLKFNSLSGRLQFDRFVRIGEPLETTLDVTLPQYFSHMETFGSDRTGRRTNIILYRSGLGDVLIGRIIEDGTEFEFSEVDGGYFRGDLTRIVPLSSFDKPRAFTFSSASGRVALRELSPLEDLGVVVR